MRALLVLSMVVSLVAEAKSLQVAEFEGKGATKLRAQLHSKLCRKLLCVEEEAEQKPTNILYGKVLKKNGKTMLEVELRDAKGGLVLTQRVAVAGKSFATRVDRAVRSALAEYEIEPFADNESEDTDAPEADAKPASVAPAQAPTASADTKAPAKAMVVARRVDEPAVDYSRRIIWLGAGVSVQSRQLAYSGLATPELGIKRETAIMPRAALALFPFAREGMSGFGIAASFASTVTSSPNELIARQLDAVVAYGLKLGGLPLWVRPEAGFRWHVLDGQGAATEYRAVRFGLALEAAVGPLRVHGQAAYLAVIGGAGELTNRYFTRARTGAAFMAEVGFAVNVVGKLDLVAAGTYDVYLHSLNADPGDLYVARGATDGYLGATGGLRLSF